MPKVKLNVGGKIFETTTETLTINSEYFVALFSNNFEQYFDENKIQTKEIFIDRSNIAFEYILDYLRDPNMNIPKKYENELVYYGINYDLNTIENPIEEKLIVLEKKINDKILELCEKIDTIKEIKFQRSGISICNEKDCKWKVHNECKECFKHCDCPLRYYDNDERCEGGYICNLPKHFDEGCDKCFDHCDCPASYYIHNK
jgi:hypothetical protein